MEKLKKYRTLLRSTFTKVLNTLNTILESQEIDQIELQATLAVLDTKAEALQVVEQQFCELLLEENVSEEDLLTDTNKADEYKFIYKKTRLRAQNILLPSSDDVNSSVHTATSQQINAVVSNKRKYKLPLIELRKFDGNLLNWLPFWSQFNKIDNDSEIGPEDKFQYLLQSVLPGTRAYDLIESFPPTAANYTKVIEGLKTRFGKDDILVEVYVRELLKLVLQNALGNKNEIPLQNLYDKLESHLRALETLGVTTDKCASILYPLVESCMPEDLLRAWQRSPYKTGDDPKDRLNNLMKFMLSEVEGEQRIGLAMSGFGVNCSSKDKPVRKPSHQSLSSNKMNVPSAASLVSSTKDHNTYDCIFCGKNHKSSECFAAQKMTLEEKQSIIKEKNCCFSCFRHGHSIKHCRVNVKCPLCKRRHFLVMCPNLNLKNKPYEQDQMRSSPTKGSTVVIKQDEVLANLNACSVLMQTLQVNVRGPKGIRSVRALIDSASQRSYILSSSAIKAGYVPNGQESIQHSLFGGNSTDVISHHTYQVHLSSFDDSYRCNFEVLDQSKICGNVSPVVRGPWIDELARQDIKFSDLDCYAPIEILIGADVAGKLWTGNHIQLECGLVAIQTKLGWTLMGRLPKEHENNSNIAVLVTTMLTTEAKLSDLWSLDSLGILDPYEKSSRQELEVATKKHFLDTVKVTDEGRFEVCLPWIEDHPPLPNNLQLARKRLSSTLKKMCNDEGLYDKYQGVFDNWLEDGIIEEVPAIEMDRPAHYLPHRPVLKLESTTPVRPVFDASAHEVKSPSLNQCLEKGPNLIEKIPSVLARFRLKKIGVIGDIRKAFLQIVLNEKDRDFLRFLWTTKEGDSKMYRHRRVVFGVTSSPFLLEASINFHLDEVLVKCQRGELNLPIDQVKTLASSFYVDNCVCSLESQEQAQTFIELATGVMNERKFELRGWEMTACDSITCLPFSPNSNVLGLLWNRQLDTLEVNLSNLKESDDLEVTKRVILSTAHRIFDPIGFTCCVTLVPKLLLQKTWIKGLSWDQEVDFETKEEFLRWLKSIHHLKYVRIPRWLPGTNLKENWTLHIFSDACQTSYASVAFLRVELDNRVNIQLVAAKSRVAPLSKSGKKITIPRLELLAASISARLFCTIKKDFELADVKVYFWTDATTVLAWIDRQDSWNVFVNNRVSEIRKLTTEHEWRYVPGKMNPADLPSRGCSAPKLLESKWWEGPEWLKESPQDWPLLDSKYDEEEISSERKKTVVSALTIGVRNAKEKKRGLVASLLSLEHNNTQWYYSYFSKFEKIVRLIAWMFRFKHNCCNKENRISGMLTLRELEHAETSVVKLVQLESFNGVKDDRLATLCPCIDVNGVIRLKTKLTQRKDSYTFRNPSILPSNHRVVRMMIYDQHVKSCHAGVQSMLCILREKYWILNGRKTIRSVINKCVTCLRQRSRHFETEPVCLPENRVRDTAVFEICGVDFAGPLILRSGEKTWICLFTCAIYRAVHLELVSSLSTNEFIQALRRFIARRGRPSVIYSDNGTNFVGTNNALDRVDWEKINTYSTVQRFEWRFNPPTAAWWGGWWERLVGLLKQLLRRTLGNASLIYEELNTVLCDCESILNSRPLTYLSENGEDLVPITPSMYLTDIREQGTCDLDCLESNLTKRYRYIQTLRGELRKRFRSEYLGQLIMRPKVSTRRIRLGEVVLVQIEDKRRLNWPLAIVEELIPGKDGEVRLVKLKTKNSTMLRPIQRIFPLEVDNSDKLNGLQDTPVERCSRSGRKIKKPARYIDEC